MDHLPPNWRPKTTISLEEEAVLEEIAKDRANSRTGQKDNTDNTSTQSPSKTSTNSSTEIASGNMSEYDGDASGGLVDEDEFHDGLPTVFDEALFPESSQQILEANIEVKALESYMNDDPRSIDARAESIAYILRQANNAYRNDSVYSVVIKPKSKLPPSGNIHDYTSLARYYWKNPDTEDGLPYVRHDGKPNPDMDSVWDYRLLRKVFRDCYYMAHGYFWTGEPRYAEKIVYRVKEWFLDEATHMNPNLKYGSLIFGTEMGRSQGVLDMFKVFAMFDALKMIEGSAAIQAEPQLIPNLQRWFTSYLEWIDASPEATQERNARNNHGTYFTVQYISILEFLGRDEEATAMAEDAKEKRVGSQIRRDGAQPHETIRPVSYFYSTFNLQGLMMLSMQAESHGVDLWNHKGPIESKTMRLNGLQKPVNVEVGGGTIEDAVRYLADYGSRDASEWPYPDVGRRSLRDVLKMTRAASLIYNNDFWPDLIERLETKIGETIAAEGEGDGETVVEDGEPNGFLCELGFLSKASLWHCYR
ncbi:hypothetical protein KI688_012606 [Linnemannia hyalina]|uniref:Alginate lyase domain-containing protein n=1 Tax=Linnemannia hyalina TaxID=64524 RepID=A0A9P7XU72_9FUNG|nr:hypothetical protein KI688_012606 [Linnemannia hyalina]